MSRAANGEGSIFFDPKRKRWIGRISVPGFKGTKRRETSAKTKAEVRKKLREIEAELAGGLRPESKSLTFGQYLDGWLEDLDELKPSTYSGYEHLIRNHLKPTLGTVMLRQLGAYHLQTLYSQKRKELAPGTIRRIHTVASRSLREARRLGLIASNPTEDVRPPKLETKPGRVLEQAEAIRLLECVKAWREDRYALFVLAISTGMRQGEILALRWKDVDLDRGEVRIRESVNTTTSPPTFGLPKSGKERTVKLPALAIGALAEHKHLIQSRVVRPLKAKDEELVFSDDHGKVILRKYVHDGFKRLLKREEFPPLTFHQLRHSAASLLLDDGTPMKAVQDLLGHASIKTTMDIYAHLTQRTRDETASRMDEILDG